MRQPNPIIGNSPPMREIRKLIETIGSGAIGAADGDFAQSSFNKPQGMVLRGTDTLYVADMNNWRIQKLTLH